MAVRFLPPPEERSGAVSEDRADLAEVIELRSLLSQRGWGSASPADDAAPSGDAASEEGEGYEAAGAAEGADASEEYAGASECVGMSEGAEADWAEPDDGDFESVEASDAPFETRLEACRQDGVKLLARRARSSGELRDELGRLHETDIVEGVVAEFEQSLYLDDTGLARALTEKLRETKRASRSQIRLKLRERRLPDAVIEAAIGELDTDEEYELLREAASERARKLGGLDRQTAERRLLGFLARRGWSGEPAMRAVREAFDGAGSRGGAGGSGGGRRSNGPGGSGVRFR